MIRKVTGIVISTVDYKESSKIVNIFTEDEGIIGVLSKGCKANFEQYLHRYLKGLFI